MAPVLVEASGQLADSSREPIVEDRTYSDVGVVERRVL
jgi:hypothetical protein